MVLAIKLPHCWAGGFFWKCAKPLLKARRWGKPTGQWTANANRYSQLMLVVRGSFATGTRRMASS